MEAAIYGYQYRTMQHLAKDPDWRWKPGTGRSELMALGSGGNSVKKTGGAEKGERTVSI